jgi:hypothetical protein
VSDARWDSEVYSDETQLVSSPTNGQLWRYAFVQSLIGPATVAGDQLFIAWGGLPLSLPPSGAIPSTFARVLYPGQTAVFDKGVTDENPLQLLPRTNWYGSFSIDTEPFTDSVVQTQPAAPGTGILRANLAAVVTATGAANAAVIVPAVAGETVTLYYLAWSIVPTTAALGVPPVGLYEARWQTTAGGASGITEHAVMVATAVGAIASPEQELDLWSHPATVGAIGAGAGLQVEAVSLPVGGALLVAGMLMYSQA